MGVHSAATCTITREQINYICNIEGLTFFSLEEVVVVVVQYINPYYCTAV